MTPSCGRASTERRFSRTSRPAPPAPMRATAGRLHITHISARRISWADGTAIHKRISTVNIFAPSATETAAADRPAICSNTAAVWREESPDAPRSSRNSASTSTVTLSAMSRAAAGFLSGQVSFISNSTAEPSPRRRATSATTERVSCSITTLKPCARLPTTEGCVTIPQSR